MELPATIKKVSTKEKDGIVTISTTFETVTAIGDTSIAGELSALHGGYLMLNITPIKKGGR